MITYLPGSDPTGAAEIATLEFVGGPWAGRREPRVDPPASITIGLGIYRRSVRCADDGALRYVFEDDPIGIGHRRLLLAC